MAPLKGSVAQVVRAQSLYLCGRWFESIQTHQRTTMPIIAAFLYIGAGGIYFLAYKGNDTALLGGHAILIGAIGTTIIGILATPAEPILTLL